MAQQFQFRGGLDTEWTAENPILADREMGVETNTKKFKIGDGVTNWNNLSYATQGNAGTIEIGTIETVEPGTPASVTNVGTPTAAKLNFKIPKGDIGVTGFTGQAFNGDFHDQLTAGYYYTAAAGQANAPNSTEKFMLIIAVGENADHVIHKATGFASGKQYINVKTAGTWIGWASLTTGEDVESFSQTVRMWQKNTEYVAGDIAYSSNLPSWARVECTAGGTTAAAEPTWPTKAGKTVTDGGVTWTIRDVRNGRLVGVENHIVSGRKITSTSGLVANLSAGKECINGYISELDANAVTLPARKACLICDKDDGSTVIVEGKYPTDYIDDNTVGFWVFNQAAGVNVPNSAVGKSTIAVANDLVPTGGVVPVDGRCDYAAKFDGTSGKYLSQNYTNIPIGAAAREVNVLWTAATGTVHQEILWWGGTSGASTFNLIQTTANNIAIQIGSTLYDTGFTMTGGTDYLITTGYTGTALYVKVNGVLIYPPVTVVLATTATVICVGGLWVTGYVYGKGTVHFVEIRNAPRSDTKTSEIANKLVLPCFYTKTVAAYPTIPETYAAVAHEYRMDETTGTAVDDSNTTVALNGTATGTTIVDSDSGLGKARKFNGTSDKISIGSFACGTDFNVVGVVNIPSYSGQPPLWSNRNSGGTSGNIIYIDSSGYLALNNGGTKYILWNAPIPLNTPLFIVVSISGTATDVYIQSATKLTTATTGALSTTANAAYLGYDINGMYLVGVADYMMFGNFALTAADVKKIYNSFMATGRRNIIDDVIPANAAAVAYVKTGSNGVTDYNDLWPLYGRREGVTGGNRKMFLPWKLFSGYTPLSWANPFGTGKYKEEIHWAEDSKGTNEAICVPRFNDGSNVQGVQTGYTAAGRNDPFNVNVTVMTGGAAYLNGAWKNTGYIGVYIEMLEDYEGVV